MHFFKIFSVTLLLVSTSLFGFCAFTLKPLPSLESGGTLVSEGSNFKFNHSDIPRRDPVFRNVSKIDKHEKYYEVMEMKPMYFNVRLEEIRNLSMQPRCVDR